MRSAIVGSDDDSIALRSTLARSHGAVMVVVLVAQS
jgi:hypothetical protein